MTELALKLPTMTSKQAEIAASPAKRKVISCGRRFGKTTLFARVACYRFVRGHKIIEAAPIAKQTNAFWRKCKLYLRPLIDGGYVHKNETDRTLELGKGYIQAQTAFDADSLRGDWCHLLLLDEYSYMDPSAWTVVGQPMLMDTDGEAWFAFTPNRRNHAFSLYSQAVGDTSGEYAAFHGTSYDNPHLKPEALARMVRGMSEDAFKQEIMAEFLEGEGAVFRNIEAVCIAPSTNPAEHAGHTIVGGVDWARDQDYTAMSLLCVNCRREVLLDRFNQVDYHQQLGRIEHIYKTWGVKRWKFELNSIGQPLFETVVRLGIPAVGFNTSLQSKSILVDTFSLALERSDIMLLPEEIGKLELQAFERKTTKTGLSSYSAPDGMHDDTVMARMLAYQLLQETPATDTKRIERVRRDFAQVRKVL